MIKCTYCKKGLEGKKVFYHYDYPLCERCLAIESIDTFIAHRRITKQAEHTKKLCEIITEQQEQIVDHNKRLDNLVSRISDLIGVLGK